GRASGNEPARLAMQSSNRLLWMARQTKVRAVRVRREGGRGGALRGLASPAPRQKRRHLTSIVRRPGEQSFCLGFASLSLRRVRSFATWSSSQPVISAASAPHRNLSQLIHSLHTTNPYFTPKMSESD